MRIDGVKTWQFNPGLFRHVLTIQTLTETVGDDGSVTKTPSTFATVRGSITPVRSSERMANAQVGNLITHIIRCHYVSGITPHMQITTHGRTFQISAASNINEMGRWLEIEAVEKL